MLAFCLQLKQNHGVTWKRRKDRKTGFSDMENLFLYCGADTEMPNSGLHRFTHVCSTAAWMYS